MMQLWGIIALAALSAGDSPVSVQVRLEPPIVPFHRQAKYSIVVEGPAEAGIKLPDMVDQFGGLGVYGSPEYQAEALPEGRVRITETYTLDPIMVGDYAIAPVVVTWGKDEHTEVASPALRVRELTEEETAQAEVFDAEIAYPAPRSPGLFVRWEFWVGVAAAVGALAALAGYWWRRRKPRSEEAHRREPWEVAYERLRTLDQRQYPKQGKFGPYYVDLSAILRIYIEDRFQVHAPEQTTQEFLSEITGNNTLSESHERVLANFLRHCDRVKFAQYRPTVEEMERSFAEVLRFIDETVTRTPEQEAA